MGHPPFASMQGSEPLRLCHIPTMPLQSVHSFYFVSLTEAKNSHIELRKVRAAMMVRRTAGRNDVGV